MKIALVLAASVLSFSALDARATTPVEAPSITVNFADLNLDRQPGIVVLYQRIKDAAHSLCKPASSEILVSKRTYMTCRNQAITAAVSSINRQMLSDYVAQQTGLPVAGTSERVAGR